MSDFMSKMKDYLDRGVEASKDAFAKAGEKVQDFGGKSVTRIEISQLKGKFQKEITKLGVLAYEAFSEKGELSVSRDNADVAAVLSELAKLDGEIAEKKALLAEASDKNA